MAPRLDIDIRVLHGCEEKLESCSSMLERGSARILKGTPETLHRIDRTYWTVRRQHLALPQLPGVPRRQANCPKLTFLSRSRVLLSTLLEVFIRAKTEVIVHGFKSKSVLAFRVLGEQAIGLVFMKKVNKFPCFPQLRVTC